MGHNNAKRPLRQFDISFDNDLKLKILKDLLPQLCEHEMTALQLRFWECMSIQQVASCLHMTWESADKLIESTLGKLRQMITEQMEMVDLQAA